jgi:hypothetical protein
MPNGDFRLEPCTVAEKQDYQASLTFDFLWKLLNVFKVVRS